MYTIIGYDEYGLEAFRVSVPKWSAKSTYRGILRPHVELYSPEGVLLNRRVRFSFHEGDHLSVKGDFREFFTNNLARALELYNELVETSREVSVTLLREGREAQVLYNYNPVN